MLKFEAEIQEVNNWEF